MFADLSDKLSAVFKKLRGETRITEKNITEASKEVRMALLEADVNYKVAKELIARVEAKALGTEVLASVSPGQQFIKIINDELTNVLGGADYSPAIHLSPIPPTIILMSGLQGSGKTTTCGKLSKFLMKSNHKIMLVACDIYRPAAIEQLGVVAKSVGAGFYSDKNNNNVVEIAKDGISQAKKEARNIVIIDTAGRLHIDNALMDEISSLKSAISPHMIFYVADAMTGQDAVNSAAEFDKVLDIDGIILTKTDGDARGGAALSVKSVTGKPVYFIGTGEKYDEFELFHPSRMASRILGMGDVVSLVEKAQEVFEDEDANALSKKIKKEGLDFNDMLKQFNMLKKMGSLGGLAKLIPGLGNALKGAGDIDESKLKYIEAIIQSMTPIERRKPSVINSSRRKRIAYGSGRTVQDVNKLMDHLTQMNKMMKKFTKMAGKGKKADNILNDFFK